MAVLMIKAREGVQIEELSDETTMILRAARRLQPDEITNFSVNRASLLSQGFDAVFAGIKIGGWVIGGFAILVGGFGIANIMFVSVRERTNIIGIQKALGAKRFFILQQFLVESVLLSVIGGLLGVLMIFIGTLVINYLYDLNIYLTTANIIPCNIHLRNHRNCCRLCSCLCSSKNESGGSYWLLILILSCSLSIHFVSLTNCSTESCSGLNPNSG